MRTKIALATYFFMGAINLVLGTIYFTSDQFLSYHAQVAGKSWEAVDIGTRTLILALMKMAGGGWLVLGFLTLVLAVGAYVSGSILARWALPTSTIIFYIVSFTTTWSVYRETGAQSPWAPSLAMIIIAAVAWLLDSPWSAHDRGDD